ncbi:glycine--tRNA ligase [bacterium]|nr:glycine--tRNA ligase [bacterium]
MSKTVSLAKRRGFVFPGSEIYGGQAGVYDYGPHGVELLNNLKKAFWKANVYDKENYFGLDSGMFKHPRVWEASGHTAGFSDPIVECRDTQTRLRVDKELEAVGVTADEKMSVDELQVLFDEHKDEIAQRNNLSGNFTPVRAFNLLVQSNLGDFTGAGTDPVYLPGEACQGIYLNYKNIVDSMSPRLPFGVVQIGKAFRNEISPRNWLFRTREFEQADTQLFIKPNENKEAYEQLKQERLDWYVSLGIKPENLRFKQHENVAFYASDAWDIEYNFPSMGWDELEGVHDRTDYDLKQHMEFSGTDLTYLDPETNERYIPWILETSVGLGRMFAAVLADAYHEEDLGEGNSRTVLKLHPDLAPYRVAVSPLLKNKPQLVEKAREVFTLLKAEFGNVAWDDNGNVGKRYRRQDEIGTPHCVTIDFDTLGEEDPAHKDTVTVRDRDTGEQQRVAVAELVEFLK